MSQQTLTGRTHLLPKMGQSKHISIGTELKHFRAILAGLVFPTFNFLSADWGSGAVSQGLLRRAPIFMIFSIFAVELLNYDSLKYY